MRTSHMAPSSALRLPVAVRVDRARGMGAVSAPTAFALAATSGALFASAFPPLSWTPVAWIALVPLLVACASLSPARAAVAGLCWTATATVGVAAFLPGMLGRYFGLGTVPAWCAAVATVAGLHGVWVTAWAAWVAWLVRRGGAGPMLVAGGWVAAEFVRAHGVLGSPWALLASSQIGWTPVVQVADFAGAYGVGMLVAGVNAGAAALLVPALRGRRPVASSVALVAALVAALAYGRWRLAEPFAHGPAAGVAVVQAGATPARAADRPARLARYVALTEAAANPATRLVVWPEYATEAYLEEPSAARDAILGVAAAAHADLVLGGPHFVPSRTGTRYHNSVYLVRDGRLAARYDKHRLVPFAEHAFFGTSGARYTPGRGAPVVPATALRLGVSICVEAMTPDLARRAVARHADVLVNVSNDAWFADAAAAEQQLAIATLRAIEMRRYLVRAAATGVSAVVDPYGRVLARSAFDTDAVVTSSVRASRARTPYQRWGDAFAWLVIAMVAVSTLRTSTHHQRRSSS